MDRQSLPANKPTWQVASVLTFVACVASCRPGILQHCGADRAANIVFLFGIVPQETEGACFDSGSG
jgi:hypothetical protein